MTRFLQDYESIIQFYHIEHILKLSQLAVKPCPAGLEGPKRKNRPKAVSHVKRLKRIKQLYGFLQLA